MVETLSQLFLNTVRTYAKDAMTMVKKEGHFVPLSTADVAERVKDLSLGLRDLGFGPGDKLVIFSENRPEWTITDFATLCAGGVTVPIYPSLMPDQVKYIINDSEAKVVVCSNRLLWLKVEAVRRELPSVRHFILVEEEAPEGVMSLAEVMGRGKTLAASGPELFEKAALAAKLVFSKIVEKTGGRVRFFVSGGAPLSKDVAEFFYAIGITILEGYGLTETAPVLACNTFDKMKFGTVGPVITDRKKDLIITAGGKNVAPQPIENRLKTNPYIQSAVVVGAGRKFISALIVPDFDKLEVYARGNGIPFASRSELARRDEIASFLLAEVNRSTPELASYERIKKIAILDRDFEQDLDEVTPTLKVKRGIVEAKFKELIGRPRSLR